MDTESIERVDLVLKGLDSEHTSLLLTLLVELSHMATLSVRMLGGSVKMGF